jgi:regulator of sirC expression with transglutaminase-like and TPR domain
MIEVGRRAGIALRGLNAPGHFLVRDDADNVVLDPFEQGAEVADADAVLAPVADAVAIVARMLNNLRSIYTSSGDLAGLIWVLRLRTLLPGADPSAAYELTRAKARLN